ncbi:hypothetical protein [Borreliella valaisiana]|uniref:hypothetical protein n=1 Tax=Borreliella valaisiana TaxID=62088 RepID=UPI001F4383A6|nr:hypothetical protein [Borreliella valaisiana]
MEKSFVSSTGHIQIAKENYFNPKFSSLKNELLLEEKDINLIRDEIVGYDELQSTNLIVNFDGLLGNSSTSNPVFKFVYEEPRYNYKQSVFAEGELFFMILMGVSFYLGVI